MIHPEVQRLRSLLRNQGPRVQRRLTALTQVLNQASSQSSEDAARIGHGLATDFPELEVIAAIVALPEEVESALAVVKSSPGVREALRTVVAQVETSLTLRIALLKTFPHVCPPPPLRIDRFVTLEHPSLEQYTAAARQLRQYIEQPGAVRIAIAPGMESVLLLLALLRQCRDEQYPPRGTILVNLTGVGSAEEIADRVSLACPGVGIETNLQAIGWHLGRQDRLVVLASLIDEMEVEGISTACASLVEGCQRGGRARILVTSKSPLPIAMKEVVIAIPQVDAPEAAHKALWGQLRSSLLDAIPEIVGTRNAQSIIQLHQALFIFGMLWPFLRDVTNGDFSAGISSEGAKGLAFIGILVASSMNRPKLARALIQGAEARSGHLDPELSFMDAMLELSEGSRDKAQKLSQSLQQPESIKRYLSLVSAESDSPKPSLRPESNLHVATMLAFGLGQQAMGQNEHADAAGHFAHAVERCRSLGNYQGVMEALHAQGTAMLAVGDVEEAITSFEQALFIAREFDLSWQECALSCDLALAVSHRGDWRRQYELLNDALAIAKGLEDGRAAIILMLLAALTLQLGRPLESIRLSREAVTIFQQFGQLQSANAMMTMMLIADAALIMDHFQEANAILAMVAESNNIEDESLRRMRAWQQAEYTEYTQISNQLSDVDSLLTEASNLPPRLLARMAVFRGDSKEAHSHFQAALNTPSVEFSSPLERSNTQAEALIGLSFLAEDPAHAIELAQRALTLIAEQDNRAMAARAWTGIGRAFTLQQNSTAAQQAFSKAASSFNQIGNESAECRIRLWLAQIALEKGQKKRAATELRKARTLVERFPSLGLPGKTLTEIADLFSSLEYRQVARGLYRAALNTYVSTNNFLEQILLHVALVRHAGDGIKERLYTQEHLRQIVLLGKSLAVQSRNKAQRGEEALGLLWASKGHIALKEAQQSLPLLVEAYKLASKVADSELKANVLDALANALRAVDRPESAEMLRASAHLLRVQDGNTHQIPVDGSELLVQVEALLSILNSTPSSASSPAIEVSAET